MMHPFPGYQNPVFQYLERKGGMDVQTMEDVGNGEEQVPKGHYIKRKITHKQTYVIPINREPEIPTYDVVYPDFMGHVQNETDMMNMAKQQFLINNIKSIISNTQPVQPFSNTYMPYVPGYAYNPYVYRTGAPQVQSMSPWDVHYANLQTVKDNTRNFRNEASQKPIDIQYVKLAEIPKPEPGIQAPRPSKNLETQPKLFQELPRQLNPSQTIPEPFKPFHPYQTLGIDVPRQYDPFQTLPETSQGIPRQFGPFQSLPSWNRLQEFSIAPVLGKNEPHLYTAVTSMIEYGQKDENCEEKSLTRSSKTIPDPRNSKQVSVLDDVDLELMKFLEDILLEVVKEDAEDDIKDDNGEEEEESTEIPAEILIANMTETGNLTETFERIGREINFEDTEKGRKLMKLLENVKLEESKSGPKGIIKYLERMMNRQKSAIELEGIEILEDVSKRPKELQTPGKFVRKPESKKEDAGQNSGSGIFINRLKVRKGGVAIAGPGGIATAGNGGTAIVGPNGVAYTQPNGMAIAGPGSRVIAVAPEVDLNQLVQNLTKNNESNPRLGRVVAIGPVVYYNKGENSSVAV